MESLWHKLLSPSIHSDEDKVRVEIFAEVLKVLLNPVIVKSEKVKILQSIQRLLQQQSEPISEETIINDILDPFVLLCGSLLHYESVIGNLVNKKSDLLYQAYSQCTFKPVLNDKANEKLAKSRYEKDASLLSHEIQKL